MLSRFPFLPGGLALFATACAVPQPGVRYTTPIDYTVLRGEQLHTERQIVEERDVQVHTVFGNLASLGDRPMSVQLATVLEAPLVGGSPLHVTRLVQQNQILLVAYASPDGRALGALALIDMSDPEAPLLRAELQLPTMAVTSVALDGTSVYFAGFSGNPAQAQFGRISIQGFEWQDDLKIQTLEMSRVSDLAVLGDKIWLLDRSQGQLLGIQKKDGVISSQLTVSGLEQLARDAASLWVMRASQLVQLDPKLEVKATYPAEDPQQLPETRGPIRIGQEMVMTVLGEGGVRAFCQADQKALFRVPAVIRAGLDPARTQTRDAALSHGLLLTANGEAGVFVYSVRAEDQGNRCKDRSLQLEGYLDLGKDFRAETLNWQQDVLSIGDGRGRLNLLYFDRDNFDADDTDFDG
jgi:hypothetical protein